MGFDRNIMKFPIMVHRDINMTALHLTPPEVSFSEIEKTNPEFAQSAYEFHAFMTELLTDMYSNPSLYGMNPGEYEKFANGFRYIAIKRK